MDTTITSDEFITTVDSVHVTIRADSRSTPSVTWISNSFMTITIPADQFTTAHKNNTLHSLAAREVRNHIFTNPIRNIPTTLPIFNYGDKVLTLGDYKTVDIHLGTVDNLTVTKDSLMFTVQENTIDSKRDLWVHWSLQQLHTIIEDAYILYNHHLGAPPSIWCVSDMAAPCLVIPLGKITLYNPTLIHIPRTYIEAMVLHTIYSRGVFWENNQGPADQYLAATENNRVSMEQIRAEYNLE